MLALPSLIDTVYLLTSKCLLEAKKEEDIIPKIFMLTDVSYEQYTILFFFFMRTIYYSHTPCSGCTVNMGILKQILNPIESQQRWESFHHYQGEYFCSLNDQRKHPQQREPVTAVTSSKAKQYKHVKFIKYSIP